jgi:hypothetical protein
MRDNLFRSTRETRDARLRHPPAQFDVWVSTLNARVLVYSNAGLLQDQTLVYGDNQFLLEIESLDQPLFLAFIHAGGYWLFTGLSGYVV